MISRMMVLAGKFRRLFSRSLWAIAILRLPRLKQPAEQPGLVMVQIDGLSMTQFRRAIEKGNMPFLARLLKQEHYTLHSFYSGLPSNTPAVQGEIFYGVKSCVPAFHFLHRESGRPVKMFDAAFVQKFEPSLRAKGEGLLAGGSSYSNIYTGGADEAHFCWGNMGWPGVLHAANPLVLPLLAVLYIDIFVRTLVLVVVEIFLAVHDCFRGTLKGRFFLRELEMIWLRALICVFLREFIVAGVCVDVMRGLPVIHMNFLGYDEQAHCRGPSSKFAHWSLQGIDSSIQRIYEVMQQSPHRSYELWVYSDHGQEKTEPYLVRHHKTVEQAVSELFGQMPLGPSTAGGNTERSRRRAAAILERQGRPPAASAQDDQADVMVTAMGPLGCVYVKKGLSAQGKKLYAEQLVRHLGIPVVLSLEHDEIIARTPHGTFRLPEQAAEVFGQDHPFLKELISDVPGIVRHPDAGELVIAGWGTGSTAISFPLEYGAHASMGPEETHSFALLPMDSPVELEGKNYLRPLDLRNAAQRFMHQDGRHRFAFVRSQNAKKPLSLMTYNVHGCVGMDGQVSVERIARVIARHGPDIIALQELDVNRARSGGIDQAERIARRLQMQYHFHPAFRWRDEQYGNAVLSRYPLSLIKTGPLPQLRSWYEPRGAIWVCVDVGGQKINVINTHLSLSVPERRLQVQSLLGPEWIGHPASRGPLLLCGDFNAFPYSSAYRMICTHFRDSQKRPGYRRIRTWFGKYPVGQIDYIFTTPEFQVLSTKVGRSDLEKAASDHLPLVGELILI